MKRALITGSCGLIGSEVSIHLRRQGFRVFGIDNNERRVFFGPEGDTRQSLERLSNALPDYSHFDVDIRDRDRILDLFGEIKPDITVHTAALRLMIARPSSPLPISIPTR